MNCASACVKYLLFIFNFIFCVCGLAILTLGVMVHLKVGDLQSSVDPNLTFPAITLIVIGSIIFVISFFGCCGAIRESHCMTITFASFLLFILLVQVAVAVFAFVNVKKAADADDITNEYSKVFAKYGTDNDSIAIVEVVQSSLHCCGVNSKNDYENVLHSRLIPGSCCGKQKTETCSNAEASDTGCVAALKDAIRMAGNVLGGVAIGVAAVELIGIIFALCLANSIRNSERRGYRV